MSSKDRLLPEDLDADRSETAVLENVVRRFRASSQQQADDVAMDYQRMVAEEDNPLREPSSGPRREGRKKQLQSLVRKVMIAKRIAAVPQAKTSPSDNPIMAQDLLDTIRNKNEDALSAPDEQNKLYNHVVGEDEWQQEQPTPEETRDDDDGPGLPVRRASGDESSSSPLHLPDWLRHVRQRRRQQAVRWKCTGNSWWILLHSSFWVRVSVPLALAALVLYYPLGNPTLDSLPATLSWWANFGARQAVTLELGRLTQWLVLDGLVLGLVPGRHPLLTFQAFQAKGWPAIVISWAVWDLLLLQGDDRFQTNWFYWTGLDIYSPSNDGGGFLASPLYLRFLWSVLVVGALTALKRLVVAIVSSRQQFTAFEPTLQLLVAEIVLLHQVADLADAVQDIDGSAAVMDDPVVSRSTSKGWASEIPWNSSDQPGILKSVGRWDEDDNADDDDESASSAKLAAKKDARPPLEQEKSRLFKTKSNGKLRITDLLDRWEEPSKKLGNESDGSIYDLLKFKRALTYLDNRFPFGEDFGPASTRNECLLSSQSIYYRLVKMVPVGRTLSFDIIALAAANDEGIEDQAKKRALRRLFRPGKDNEVTMLAFVQTCDNIYKRLCFFRASVNNASAIDNVSCEGHHSLYFSAFLV